MLQIIMIMLSSGKLFKIFSSDFSLKDKYAIPMINAKVRVLRIEPGVAQQDIMMTRISKTQNSGCIHNQLLESIRLAHQLLP